MWHHHHDVLLCDCLKGLSGEISGNSEDHLTNEDTIGMLVRYFMRSKGEFCQCQTDALDDL